jgi:hypothetical protein
MNVSDLVEICFSGRTAQHLYYFLQHTARCSYMYSSLSRYLIVSQDPGYVENIDAPHLFSMLYSQPCQQLDFLSRLNSSTLQTHRSVQAYAASARQASTLIESSSRNAWWLAACNIMFGGGALAVQKVGRQLLPIFLDTHQAEDANPTPSNPQYSGYLTWENSAFLHSMASNSSNNLVESNSENHVTIDTRPEAATPADQTEPDL